MRRIGPYWFATMVYALLLLLIADAVSLESMSRMKSRLGIYAILGNQEYYGGLGSFV